VVTGETLANGIAVKLPESWLAKGDGPFSTEFANQEEYGSDVLLLQKLEQK
jgi:hypothetical protein